MQNVDDLRVRRTRILLQKALVELTIEKGFAEVTVSDLTERAMVNRSTFYRHYLDKYDLLRHYITELTDLIDAQGGETSSRDQPDQPRAGLVRILKHIQQNADFYRVMLGKQGDPVLCAESFRPYIEKGFLSMLADEVEQVDPSRPPLGLSVSYILHAGMGAIIWWLENDQPVTPEQMAVWLNRFSMADLSFSLGLDGKAADSR
ncbi:MAG: TetR/AcrR family transcriptional regulator C-terminal domain-containing protein [Anaerolineales bacterium]